MNIVVSQNSRFPIQLIIIYEKLSTSENSELEKRPWREVSRIC